MRVGPEVPKDAGELSQFAAGVALVSDQSTRYTITFGVRGFCY